MATPRTLLPPAREGLELRCAALALGGNNGSLWNESPPHRRVDLHRLGGDAEARRIESAAFAAWLDAASAAASSTEDRRSAALRGAYAAAGDLPSDLRLLEPAKLLGRDFSSPVEWARAEWSLVWEEAAVRLAQQWEEDLKRAMADTSEVYLLLGRVQGKDSPWEEQMAKLVGDEEGEVQGRGWGDVTLDSTAGVVQVLPHLVLTSEQSDRVRRWAKTHAGALMQGGEPEVLLRAPAPVARWLVNALFSELCVQIAPVREEDTLEVAETALELWEPEGGGALSDPHAAFEAARGVLAEHSA